MTSARTPLRVAPCKPPPPSRLSDRALGLTQPLLCVCVRSIAGMYGYAYFSYGGGIYQREVAGVVSDGVELVMLRCTLSNNTSIGGGGGGIYAVAPYSTSGLASGTNKVTLEGCTLTGNYAGWMESCGIGKAGGGIMSHCDLTLIDTVITYNTASNTAGPLWHSCSHAHGAHPPRLTSSPIKPTCPYIMPLTYPERRWTLLQRGGHAA